MIGLFIKDFRILLSRKQGYVILLLVSVLMGFSSGISFQIGYVTFLGCILATGTISYDEFDNGMAFLMTLPIDVKQYIKEKYMFCLASILVGWVISICLAFVTGLIKGYPVTATDIVQSLIMIPIAFVMSIVIIPFFLKYGAEKGRFMMIIFGVGIIAIFKLGVQLMNLGSVASLIQSHPVPDVVCLVLAIIVVAVLCMISYVCSSHIMMKKQY